MNKQKQSGFAHMGIIVLILTIALVGALGYIFWQNFIKTDDKKASSTNSATSNVVNNKEKTVSCTGKTSELITEINQSVCLPKEYSVEKGTEENRFGTYAHYFFNREPHAEMSLSSINLYSEVSIAEFYDSESNNTGPLRAEGDYFGLNDFSGLWDAYKNCSNYQAKDVLYKCNQLSNGKWLIATHDYSSRKQGYVREYINTLTGGTIIGVNVSMDAVSFSEKDADKLFEQLSIY